MATSNSNTYKSRFAFGYEGQRFGRWTILTFSHKKGLRTFYWHAKCDCGISSIVDIRSVERLRSASCGCQRIEEKKWTKHALTNSAEYKIWENIIQRTTNLTPKSRVYKYYQGAGVSIDPRWLKFENFYIDVGPRPSPKHSIDRWPNREGNYEKTNVRWATREEQANNMRSNRFLTFDGKTQTIAQWARELQVNYKTFYNRVRKWGVNRAVLHSLVR